MRINIHYKITLIFILIAAIILSAIYFYLNASLREDTYQRISANLIRQASLAKSYVEKDFYPAIRSRRLDAIADKIGEDLGLRVTIIGLDGTVLGDSELDEQALAGIDNHLARPEVQEALSAGSGRSERFSTTVKENMLYTAMVFGEGRPEGIVRLSMPLSGIELISNHLKRLLIASLLFAFICAVIISFISSIFISRPIRGISWAAGSIARGDFSRRILIKSNDEMGDLARAFNYMTEQVGLRVQEVTASKSRLEAVLLSMFEGVMVVDSRGTILLMNPALKNFLHIKEQSSGRKPLEVLRNIEIQDIVDSALKLKRGVESREISLLLPEEKILLVHATPVIHENKSEGAVLVFHDITELRKLEKIRQDFVANVSHELRTPASSIKGYAETLLDGALKEKRNAEDFVKIIHSDSERLAKLIDDLLDLSKIESGKLKMNLKPCSLLPIARRVTSGLKKQAQDRSITIKLEIPDDLPRILADEARIAQVLLNLVDNAVKYNHEGGSVIISAQEKNKFIQTDISDNGVGIPEKDLPRLFERFYRIDKARSRELGGTGLGLSIVKHIVQAHAGEISVRSTLGRGSTFSFTIPRA